MRGKRSKAYRKLMKAYSLTFGHREPYQILVDAGMVKDTCRFKMELLPALERTVHGKVKPMITQCEIRHLYAMTKEPGIDAAIEVAKTLERRRCNHHPDDYPEPLPTIECMMSVVDPKGSGNNPHRYCVASQDQELRKRLRMVEGCPLIYVNRSVMILEPMAAVSEAARNKDEKLKFRAELKGRAGKRKRGDGDESGPEIEGSAVSDDEGEMTTEVIPAATEELPKKKQQKWGKKGPNPLSVKKAKPKATQDKGKGLAAGAPSETPAEAPTKKKRKRKHKSAAGVGGEESQGAAGSNAAPLVAAASEVMGA